MEMIVLLKIPDTTAITAFKTLKEMGFDNLKHLGRATYYHVGGNVKEEDLKNVDVLVNVNKNTVHFKIEKEEGKQYILVKDKDQGDGLLNTLHKLGLEGVTKIEKGVLWVLEGVSKEEAIKIAEELLANRHYQEYKAV